MLALVVIYGLLGLVFIGISIPLALGKVKPNSGYGFRVPKTMNNPDIWYSANAYAGKGIIVAGVALLTAALLLPLVPGMNLALYAFLYSLLLVVSLGIAIWMSFMYVKKL